MKHQTYSLEANISYPSYAAELRRRIKVFYPDAIIVFDESEYPYCMAFDPKVIDKDVLLQFMKSLSDDVLLLECNDEKWDDENISTECDGGYTYHEFVWMMNEDHHNSEEKKTDQGVCDGK